MVFRARGSMFHFLAAVMLKVLFAVGDKLAFGTMRRCWFSDLNKLDGAYGISSLR